MSKWISVLESKPEPNIPVWVYNIAISDVYAVKNFYNVGCQSAISHWMYVDEFPKPPEGKIFRVEIKDEYKEVKSIDLKTAIDAFTDGIRLYGLRGFVEECFKFVEVEDEQRLFKGRSG